jgi:hypothetical protein
MSPTITRTTRRSWHSLTRDEKRLRVTELRRRQQHDIEVELRRLQLVR